MSVLSPELRGLIIRRHHVVARSELVADGVAPRTIDRWSATGVLVEVERRVYALEGALGVDPFSTRAAAASLADPAAVCDPITSARVWGLPGVFRIGRPSTTPGRGVPAAHLIERHDGIRVLSPAATWLGLASVLTARRFADWTPTVVGSHVAVADAHDVVRRMARPDIAAHRRAIAAMSADRRWQRPPASPLERRVRASFRRRGLTGLDGSHRIRLADGVVGHPTVVDHDRRWGVEIDHVGWHGGRWPRPTARRLDAALGRAGWRIVKLTDLELEADFVTVMDAVAADLRAARRAG